MGVFHPDLTRASISGWGSMEIMKEAVPFSQLHMSLLLNTIWVDIKHPDYCHNFLPCGNFQKYLLCAFGVKHDAKTSWVSNLINSTEIDNWYLRRECLKINALKAI